MKGAAGFPLATAVSRRGVVTCANINAASGAHQLRGVVYDITSIIPVKSGQCPATAVISSAPGLATLAQIQHAHGTGIIIMFGATSRARVRRSFNAFSQVLHEHNISHIFVNFLESLEIAYAAPHDMKFAQPRIKTLYLAACVNVDVMFSLLCNFMTIIRFYAFSRVL